MKKIILFDFDGVIADSFQSALEVQQMICPHVTSLEYKKRFDGNIHEWKDEGVIHTSECRFDIDFNVEYGSRMKNNVTIVPHIEDVLISLHKKYVLVVVSSTISGSIKDFLVSHDLAHYFEWIMGSDIHTSKVEKIKIIFEKYNTTSGECVFITDTLGDMREAEVMNVGAIGVMWGFQDEVTLESGNPFCIVNKPQDLPAAIDDYFEKIAL